MTAQDTKKKSLKELMRTGEGLTGFVWPETYTDFDIKILRDGTWTYQNSPIEREKLCQLFSTVLQKDQEGVYWLVTPGERGRIIVEDAPFTAVEMLQDVTAEGDQVLKFRSNLGYWVTANADHQLRVETDPNSGEPSPYIHMRDGLDARLTRAVFYDLVDLAKEHDGRLFVTSGGTTFDLGSFE